MRITIKQVKIGVILAAVASVIFTTGLFFDGEVVPPPARSSVMSGQTTSAFLADRPSPSQVKAPAVTEKIELALTQSAFSAADEQIAHKAIARAAALIKQTDALIGLYDLPKPPATSEVKRQANLKRILNLSERLTKLQTNRDQ